jgi:prepilin-type N-terminal cleavage/methylation domain-containing protein
MLNKKGFTLIELLVVIAIIGILASIVLVSLNNARNRGYDAEIKSELAQVKNSLEMYYDDNGGSYTNFDLATEGLTGLGVPKCSADYGTDGKKYNVYVTKTTYVIWADLCGGSYDWCMDSNGNSRETASEVGETPTVCP